MADDAERDAMQQLERDNAALRRGVHLLYEVANLTRESLELEGILYAVLTGVTAGVGLGLNRAMLFLVDPERPDALLGAAAVGPTSREEADTIWKAIEADAPDLRRLYEDGQRLRLQKSPLDERVREIEVDVRSEGPLALAFRLDRVVRRESPVDLEGLLHPATGIAAPLRGRGGPQGVLYGDNRFTWRRLDDVGVSLFEMIANHTGYAIENARRYEDVARAARTDALTGLGHHGSLMLALGHGVDRARAGDRSLSVVMIDLDDFKRINDTLGHLAGDRLLASVAERLRRAVRRGTIFRYGGEEFTAVLEGVELGAAITVAERLRRAIQDESFDVGQGEPIVVTCSLGVAARHPNESANDLLGRADAALLRAKRLGKNRAERA